MATRFKVDKDDGRHKYTVMQASTTDAVRKYLRDRGMEYAKAKACVARAYKEGIAIAPLFTVVESLEFTITREEVSA